VEAREEARRLVVRGLAARTLTQGIESTASRYAVCSLLQHRRTRTVDQTTFKKSTPGKIADDVAMQSFWLNVDENNARGPGGWCRPNFFEGGPADARRR
jgi:hypothetical protein